MKEGMDFLKYFYIPFSIGLLAINIKMFFDLKHGVTFLWFLLCESLFIGWAVGVVYCLECWRKYGSRTGRDFSFLRILGWPYVLWHKCTFKDYKDPVLDIAKRAAKRAARKTKSFLLKIAS